MAATCTVTGTAGAGGVVTAQVFTDVTSFEFDCVNNLLTMRKNSQVININIVNATTITATKSGSVYTLTVS